MAGRRTPNIFHPIKISLRRESWRFYYPNYNHSKPCRASITKRLYPWINRPCPGRDENGPHGAGRSGGNGLFHALPVSSLHTREITPVPIKVC